MTSTERTASIWYTAGPSTAEMKESRRFGISDVTPSRPASTTKRFVTCFDRGYGHTFNIAGEVSTTKNKAGGSFVHRIGL